jgi:tRNA (cmo5U34)-methyltransferase
MPTEAAPRWKAVYESERASLYDAFIDKAAMNYQGALDAVLTMAGRTPRAVRRILDLGAGTGRLTALALERFPRASVLAVDGSAAMLDRARARLAPFGGRAAFACKPFEELLDSLDGRYDLALSSFALHHLEHGAMRALLRRLHEALAPGGQLVVADYVLSRSSRLQGWYEETWVEHRLSSEASGKTKEQMLAEHEATKAAEGDNPAPLEDLIRWTEEAGFRDAGCHWRYYCYAVYGGLA